MTTEAPHTPWNDQTLFHLIPYNDQARIFLNLPENKPWVSPSASEEREEGFEIGFHSSNIKSATVVATIGRAGSFKVKGRNVSRLSISFRIAEETGAVVLYNYGSHRVRLIEGEENEDEVLYTVDKMRILTPGRRLRLKFNELEYRIIWTSEYFNVMRAKVRLEATRAAAGMEALSETEQDTHFSARDQQKNYLTRVKCGSSTIEEDDLFRVEIGEGSGGKVFSTADLNSPGNLIAVKQKNISLGEEGVKERLKINNEIKMLKRCNHKHIVEFVCSTSSLANPMELYMPYRAGTLYDLARKGHVLIPVYKQVLQQILDALHYLEGKRICHRDVKPQNILYDVVDAEKHRYHFQLADFGEAVDISRAGVRAGTRGFMAPEVANSEEPKPEDRLKGDVWSLYATLVFLKEPGLWDNGEKDIRKAIASGRHFPEIRIMARREPTDRPTAAACLLEFFKGVRAMRSGCIYKIPSMADEVPLPAGSMSEEMSWVSTQVPAVAGKPAPKASANDGGTLSKRKRIIHAQVSHRASCKATHKRSRQAFNKVQCPKDRRPGSDSGSTSSSQYSFSSVEYSDAATPPYHPNPAPLPLFHTLPSTASAEVQTRGKGGILN